MNEQDANRGVAPAPMPPTPAVGTSLFGSPAQYTRSAREPMADHEASVTGATAVDPARVKTPAPALKDADWANPLNPLKVVTKDCAISFVTYWVTYGLTLVAMLLLVSAFTGDLDSAMLDTLPGLITLAPVYGLFMDLSMIASMSWYAVFGVACFIAEFILGLFFLFASEWPVRLQYCVVTVAFVVLKCTVFVLGRFIA